MKPTSWYTPLHNIVDTLMLSMILGAALVTLVWQLDWRPGFILVGIALIVMALSTWFEWHTRCLPPLVLVSRREWHATRTRAAPKTDDLVFLRKQAD